MDKGFYNANVFKTMEDRKVDYVVPVKKFPEMKLTYRVAEVTDKWYWKYTMNLGKPNEHMTIVYMEEKGTQTREHWRSCSGTMPGTRVALK